MSSLGQIEGGAFQVARKLFESKLWLQKPSGWKVIWIYILGQVSHNDTKLYERGEGFFMWTKIIQNESLGKDIKIDMIKKATAFFKSETMISTKRSTRGVRIKVLNYNVYQTLDNYSSTKTSTKKALRKHYDRQECKEWEEEEKIRAEKAETSSASKSTFNPLGAEIIKAFETVDSKNKTYYSNTTQRKACDFLLEEYGLEEILKRITVFPKTNKIPYFPPINSPNDLKEKWVKLQDAVDRKRMEAAKITKNTPNVIF